MAGNYYKKLETLRVTTILFSTKVQNILGVPVAEHEEAPEEKPDKVCESYCLLYGRIPLIPGPCSQRLPFLHRGQDPAHLAVMWGDLQHPDRGSSPEQEGL